MEILNISLLYLDQLKEMMKELKLKVAMLFYIMAILFR